MLAAPSHAELLGLPACIPQWLHAFPFACRYTRSTVKAVADAQAGDEPSESLLVRLTQCPTQFLARCFTESVGLAALSFGCIIITCCGRAQREPAGALAVLVARTCHILLLLRCHAALPCCWRPCCRNGSFSILQAVPLLFSFFFCLPCQVVMGEKGRSSTCLPLLALLHASSF